MSSQQDGIGRQVLTIAAVLLATANLRPAITTISASLDGIDGTYGLGPSGLIMLSAIPVLSFALSAPAVPWLSRTLGSRCAIVTALLMLAVCLVVRAIVPALMLPVTCLCGAAIMIVSVLVPQILKTRAGAAWATGAATVGFGLGAAIGAGTLRPLQAAWGGSLPLALASWALPALLAAGVFMASGLGAKSTVAASGQMGHARSAPLALLSQPTARAVTVFFGLQAVLYFALTSWLPSVLLERGLDAGEAGGQLAWFSFAGLLPSLLAPVLASRRGRLRRLVPLTGLAIAAGLLWLLVAPTAQLALAIGWLGVAQGAAFSLAIALVVQRTSDAAAAGALSSVSQGMGFGVGALGSAAVGAIHQESGTWWPALLMLLAAALCLAMAGHRAANGASVGMPSAPPAVTACETSGNTDFL